MISFPRLAWLIPLLSLTSCTWLVNSQQPHPPVDSTVQKMDAKDGMVLYRYDLKNKNIAYLQVIDIRKTYIDQLVGAVDRMGNSQGKYYLGEGKSASPYFKMQTVEDVQKNYDALYRGDVFTIINAAFFEDYQASSRLSFPHKIKGQIITGGSSPYGPIRKPADPYYSKVQLKALTWDDQHIAISDYDPATGTPLNQTTVQNALVSYRYQDHPAQVFSKGAINRYQLLGTLDQDGQPGDEQLAIVTINRGTLEDAAQLLRKVGVKGDILTLDGGSSTYLYHYPLGNLTVPQPAQANDKNDPNLRKLPHYLGVRARPTVARAQKIHVEQPAGSIQIQPKQPYLIFWQDNLTEGNVAIALYPNNQPIKLLAERPANQGIYEWTPEEPLPPSASVRISSIKDPQIFDTLNLQPFKPSPKPASKP